MAQFSLRIPWVRVEDAALICVNAARPTRRHDPGAYPRSAAMTEPVTPDLMDAVLSTAYWLCGLATLGLVSLTVVLHFEGLDWLGRAMRHWPLRARMVLLILCLIVLHTIEIWLFGAALHGLALLPALQQPLPLKLLDAVYLSSITYTTVGYGDLVPHGALRLLMASEALTGLMMITWSASFTYLEMERYWRPQRVRRVRHPSLSPRGRGPEDRGA